MLKVFNAAFALIFIVTIQTVSARSAPDGFADLAERLMPAVVNIATTQKVSGESPHSGIPGPFNDMFEDFMRKFPQQGPNAGPRQNPPREREIGSLGSGFIIHPEGIVVTNNHVVEGADEITVNLADGEKYVAELIGRDSKTDLAVLKIKAKRKFPFVKFGDSQKSRVGEWVIAIGNPFGLGGSLSAGIISAINRDINAGPYDSFIQTDTAINRGNSGGPLFNMDGEVIGVNSAIISPSGGSVGIGFSIPSDLAQNVIEQLQKYGETRRGWLGVRIQQVTDELALTLGLPKAQGALVSEVSEGGPADKSGIEAGDVILSFDGQDIVQMRDLPRIVAETTVDKRVSVIVFRKGAKKELKVVTGKLDETEQASVLPESKATKSGAVEQSILGMTLVALDEKIREGLSLDKNLQGAFVSDLDNNSVAYDSGVRLGDIITKVGAVSVQNGSDVIKAIEALKAKKEGSVLLLLRNANGSRFVALKLDSKN